MNNHFSTTAEEFECVADWSDDATYYLIARLLTNSSMYLEQKYRCFTYTQEQGGEYAYLMGHNNAPLCGDIGESFALTYKISELIGGESTFQKCLFLAISIYWHITLSLIASSMGVTLSKDPVELRGTCKL